METDETRVGEREPGAPRVWPYRPRSGEELLRALEEIGCDPRAFPYFEAKRDVRVFRIADLDARGANVLKQEALARGADAAIHARCVDGGVSRSDGLLFATPKQLGQLLDKLAAAPYFGLGRLREELRRAAEGIERRPGGIDLPRGRRLTFSGRSRIMGILNLTPDSFYAGSRVEDAGGAADRAARMVAEGADLLDLGAESTRPGSDPVPEEEERARLVPALRAIRSLLPEVPLSVDTNKAAVAREALAAGADMINDITALEDPEMARVVAESGAALVLMHMKGTPRTMQEAPAYGDVLGEVRDFLAERIRRAEEAGVPRDRIVLDPGIGFGKRKEDNLRILRHLEAFRGFGLPLLIGHSRKSLIGRILDSPDPADRLEGTLAISALCAAEGVEILRVHDVRENLRVLRTVAMVRHGSAD